MAPSVRIFTPDCSNCAALCCVAFAFDRSEEFGHDKPADHPCHHLDGAYRCRIHDDLNAKGYSGCRAFDCLGAGQRVTQDLFGGGDWQREPALRAPMSAAFRTMRRLHELLQLLTTAKALHLDDATEAERCDLLDALDPEDGWTIETLAGFDAGPLAEKARGFLLSLAATIRTS